MTPVDDNEMFDSELEPLAELLERQRPVPRPAFRGELGRHLSKGGRRSVSMRRHWRLLASAYGAVGALCMAVAAIGLAGAGPFAS